MPWYDKDAYDDKDKEGWPTDDVPADFNVDDEFKDVEEYLEEYDE